MNDRNTVSAAKADTDPCSSEQIDEDSPGLIARIKQKFGKKTLGELRQKMRLGQQNSPRRQINELLREDAVGRTSDFSRQERSMLRNILRFDTLRVDDVMLPRADIVAIDEQASLGELFTLFETTSHSRIPLYRETLDDPRGMVHIKDLILWIASRSTSEKPSIPQPGKPTLRLVDTKKEIIDLANVDLEQSVAAIKIRRSMLYVPPSMPVLDLLLRMQSTRTHLALVVDEYGGTDGLVSIEDLVEEVVGEIEDEHDAEEGSSLVVHPSRGLLAKARTTIEELELHLGYDLVPDDEDDIDTLGGLVFALAKRVPVRGEIVSHPSGLEFEVLDADPRRIKRLRIHLPKETPFTPDHHRGPKALDNGK